MQILRFRNHELPMPWQWAFSAVLPLQSCPHWEQRWSLLRWFSFMMSFSELRGCSVCTHQITSSSGNRSKRKCSRPGWMELWAAWSGGRCPCSWQGGWNQMIFKVPSNLNRSVILWAAGEYRSLAP